MSRENKSILDNEKSIIIEDTKYFYGKVLPKVTLSESERDEILREFPIPSLPPTKKGTHLSDFVADEFATNLTVLVNDVTIKKASNNKPYLDLVLSNTSGSFKAKLWSDEIAILEQTNFFEENKVVKVSGKVDEFPKGSGNKSLTIRTYLPVEESINTLELLPVTDKDLESLTLELVYYLKQLQEPHQTIALAGLKKVWKGFRLTPGAKFHHHAYLGGLLKHTLGLVRLSWFIGKKFHKPAQAMFELLDTIQKEHKKEMAEKIIDGSNTPYQKLTWGGSIEHIYEQIHRFALLCREQEFSADSLISSAVWHDFGKHFELTFAGDEVNKYRLLFPYASDIDDYSKKYNKQAAGITMDELGLYVGHMPFGILLFQRTIEEEKISIGLDLIHEYMHNILSHHGKLEWGSSVTPKTPTAVALHLVDYFDSRYEGYELSIKSK